MHPASTSSAARTWVEVCAADALVIDTPLSVTARGRRLCVVRTDCGIFALDDRCTHEDVALSAGDAEGTEIECWLHCSRFDLRSGDALNPPAVQPVLTHPVRVSGGKVLVGLPDPGSAG